MNHLAKPFNEPLVFPQDKCIEGCKLCQYVCSGRQGYVKVASKARTLRLKATKAAYAA